MINIEKHKIGRGHPPFIIAEMSGNHNQSIDRALKIVDAAAESGAHGFKLQTYTPDTMTLDLKEGEFKISDPNSPWVGRSLYELYGEAHTNWEWHGAIFKRARKLGMVPFSTPFDETAVDFLEELGAQCYKIASFENTDLNLIRRVAATGKPIIISTGMATVAELDETVQAARNAGCDGLVLLKCTSTYPSTPENSNILTIPHLRDLFDCEVGLSDHTMGSGVAVASVALGASVIEKHFTLRRADGGVDSSFSLEPTEFLNLSLETKRAWQALGNIQYGPLESEKSSIQFRRSLYVIQDIKAGDILSSKNLKAIRPGHGLAPKYLRTLLGRTVSRDVSRGTAMTWDLLV